MIFNDAFQCFLGNADNLAEVATHRLGHGLGFGHSTVPDAIMRSYAYGRNGRGPRPLGDDDRDGAHCLYPHTFALTAPNGGEAHRFRVVHVRRDLETRARKRDRIPARSTWSTRPTQASGRIALSTAQINDGSYLWAVGRRPGLSSPCASCAATG